MIVLVDIHQMKNTVLPQHDRRRATFVHLLGHGECTCKHGLAADGHLHEASAGPWQSLLEQLTGVVVVVEHLNDARE